ncbi:hypothetical protein AX15_005776 [Amanita polypyramis BW_CC]|nr:hypothetical protein AX15_005776 [Amanita polypyramis BW_CC]
MSKDEGEVLEEEITDYQRVMERRGEHADTLDLGMTLWTAHWFSNKENWATSLAEKCFEKIHLLSCTLNIVSRSESMALALESNAILKKSPQWDSHKGASAANDLQPINMVMYATALIPGATVPSVYNRVSEPAKPMFFQLFIPDTQNTPLSEWA